MAFPLIQTGPGGDFTTCYEVNGRRLRIREGEKSSTEGNGNLSSGQEHDYSHSHKESNESVVSAKKFKPLTFIDRIFGIDRVDISSVAELKFDAEIPSSKQTLRRSIGTALDESTFHVRAAMGWLSSQRSLVLLAHNQTVNAASFIRSAADSINKRKDGYQNVRLAGVSTYTRPGMESGAKQTGVPVESKHEFNTQTTGHSQNDPRLADRLRLFPDDAGARRRIRRKQSDYLRARGSAYSKGSIEARSQQGSLFIYCG